jgi:glutathione S-transferase
MSLVIYGKPASRTFRVLWAAEELGLVYENLPYDFQGEEIRSAAFAAINPNASIPAIVDDGRPLFESLAINLYLARKANRLWPATLPAEALVYQWTLWAATEVESPLGTWYYNTHALPEPKRSAQLAEDAAKKVEKKLDVLDAQLARSAWLADAEFTIADLNVAGVLYRGPAFGLSRWPHVADWHSRCYARPAARKAVALREARA